MSTGENSKKNTEAVSPLSNVVSVYSTTPSNLNFIKMNMNKYNNFDEHKTSEFKQKFKQNNKKARKFNLSLKEIFKLIILRNNHIKNFLN
jgi:hypothetical protein